MRLERENKKLLADNLRLDTENDNLARELLTSKIEMRKDIDQIEDTKDFYEKGMDKYFQKIKTIPYVSFFSNKIFHEILALIIRFSTFYVVCGNL